MTGNERRIKRKIQLIVGGAMVVFFGLCLVLAVQLAIMGNQRTMERNLRNANTRLHQQLNYEQGMHDFILSDRFIDEFILRELGYARDGAQIFN